ncbi:4'-phosphopantetheinyl transferase [Jiella sp. M17.18]|uniref:4'-phosphopantetheinyl transferase family protein n=1 Tax=Jiella sp. M17.18 TaxID=3234247 RepID=UPI0034DF90C2
MTSPASIRTVGGAQDVPALERELSSIAPPHVLVGCKRIEAGDEALLLDEERRSLTALVPIRRRASGAARSVARRLLAQTGLPGSAILRSASGAPVWPEGRAGSMAHDDELAVAAVARTSDVMSLGIDIEAATPLPVDLWELVAPACGLWARPNPGLAAKIQFCVKEAVYKSVFPLDGRILDFADIDVDLEGGLASTSSGHAVHFRCRVGDRVTAIACVLEPTTNQGSSSG